MSRFILLLIALPLLNACKTSQEIIPFILTDHNIISVKAVLNDADTLNLMFHTAANSISLTSTAVEKIEKKDFADAGKAKSWGGEGNARSSTGNTLQVGSFRWENQTVWESKNSGPGTGSKFGPDLFEGKVVEIDFDKNELIIHQSLPGSVNKFEKVEADFEDGFISINGKSIIGDEALDNRFLVRSGYRDAILFDDNLVAENQLGDKLAVLSESRLTDSYGNILKTKKAVLPIFMLGQTGFSDLPVSFFEGAIGRQKMSVVGSEILKRFKYHH